MMAVTPEFTLASFVEIANISFMLVGLYMFATGKIVAKSTMDKMLEEANNRTNKLVDEIAQRLEGAVENGIIKGYAKMDSKKE